MIADAIDAAVGRHGPTGSLENARESIYGQRSVAFILRRPRGRSSPTGATNQLSRSFACDQYLNPMVMFRSNSTGGFIEPCLPCSAEAPPFGPEWIHEIKQDGFRIMARRDVAGVRLFTRKGNDFADRFPQIAAAVAALPVRSCLIDGEAIVCNDSGLAVFELVRRHWHGSSAVLCAFDLIELDGRDLRRLPIEQRKQTLAKAVRGPHPGIVLNEHYEGDGESVFKHACKLGCEGIVSKRLGSSYRSGRCAHWIKVKNPAAPAVTREAEQDWT